MANKQMDQDTKKLAERIWNYMRMNQRLEKADCILVLGGHDIRVAEYGARLFLEGCAPLMVCSGGLAHQDDLLKTGWSRPEAEVFAETAVVMGVPADKILIEDRSTNTGDNFLFTGEMLKRQVIDPVTFVVVQKPYMERRAYATFRKVWPDKHIVVTSPQIPFEDYPTEKIPMDLIIHIMVGDLQRIRAYAEKGFQIPQEIPDDVWGAYEELVRRGYTKHLLTSL